VGVIESPYGDSFFETEQHRAAAVRAIRESILPLKFAYTGSGARAHDAFVRSLTLKTEQPLTLKTEQLKPEELKPEELKTEELKTERQLLPVDEVRSGISREIVEIGPGNGARTAATVQWLASLGYPCHRLLAVDFSATLLAAARRRISDTADAPVVDTALWDIEQGSSECVRQWRGPGPVLACFLGNTLGNVESDVKTLANLHAALNPNDILLVGVMPRRPESDVLAPYRTDSFVAAVLEPLRAAGVDPDDVGFDLYWSGLRVRGMATFRRALRIDTMDVPPGYRLRCFQSRRYTRAGIVSLMEGAGFLVQRSSVDPAEDHMIVMALRGERRNQ
jgi:hypothetical protein